MSSISSGKRRTTVQVAVGQRRRAEAAVASRGAGAGLVLLDDDDLALGVALFREQRRPQPGVAGTDDAQVGTDVPDQGRVRRRFQRVRIEPPQFGLDVGEVA